MEGLSTFDSLVIANLETLSPLKTNSEARKSREPRYLQSSYNAIQPASISASFCFRSCACCGGYKMLICRENRIITMVPQPMEEGVWVLICEVRYCCPNTLPTIERQILFLSGLWLVVEKFPWLQDFVAPYFVRMGPNYAQCKSEDDVRSPSQCPPVHWVLPASVTPSVPTVIWPGSCLSPLLGPFAAALVFYTLL